MLYKFFIKCIWLKVLNCANDLTEHMSTIENVSRSSSPKQMKIQSDA